MDFAGVYYFDGKPEKKKPVALGPGMHRIDEPLPRTGWYHYSNSASQGALICETQNFPAGYHKEKEEYHCAYSDRIASWDNDRFKRACKLAGGGDQDWGSSLPRLADKGLCEFAKEALGLSTIPKHVRVIHYYNVSSGYSCPVVIAITDKEDLK